MPERSKSPTTNASLIYFVRQIGKFIAPYKGLFLLGSFLRLTSDIANLYPVWAFSRLIQLFANRGSIFIHTQEIVLLLIGWAVSRLYYSIAHAIAKLYGYEVAEKVAIDSKLKALKHIFTLDIAWQEKENTGNKLKRIDSGSQGLNRVIRSYFDVIIEACLNSAGLFVIFSLIGPELGIAIFVFMITYFVLSTHLTKKASKQEYVVNAIQEDLEGMSFEALNNIKTVKSLSIHATLESSLTHISMRTFEAIKKRILLFRVRSGALLAYYTVFEIGMISYLVFQIMHGRYELSVLILFVGYIKKVDEAVSELAEVTHEIVIAKVNYHRLADIMMVKPTIESSDNQKKFPVGWKHIEFREVTFSYEEKTIIKNFNLTIQRGQKVGIVGLSGAGKTTLFALLLDLYENYQGEILIDSVPLKEINRQDYINHLAVVLQDTELFNVSLKDNILIGDIPERSSDTSALEEAISSSYLTDVIKRLPQGMDTIIGEKGVKLSGGEKQRLGIARALYRKPDILLLDEATSHLDVESEKKIQTSLHSFFNKVTAIVIAHRLSTIKEMDIIVVMQGGRIIEKGSFEALISQKGVFSQLWEKQKL